MSDDVLQKQINEIMHKRAHIKNDYVKAWLAANVPDEHLNADWLINNVRLVEQRTQGNDPLGFNYSWHLEFKRDADHGAALITPEQASPGNADCQHSEVILTNEGKRLECLLCTASRNFAVSPFAVDTDKP